MDGLILYLISLLGNRFARDVSQIYYGDIGVYLPSSFGGSRKEQKCIIALSPAYNRLGDDRVVAFEERFLGIDIICMVNITPYFAVSPSEAFGEQKLVRLATEVATFLTQEEYVNLGGRVQMTKVGDIDWAWLPKGDQAIRGAAVAYEARVRIPRI